jgi:hypothetical protein
MNKESGLTKHLGIKLFALHSILAQTVSGEAQHASSVTNVHCVESSCMKLENVPHDKIFPIMAKLKANAWETTLRTQVSMINFMTYQ